ncbi:Carbon catabolite repressor protein 4 homolog 4 [Galdieria sulphuraria]|uniref:CCR4-NOT transcription complex subunit 6 n=1 Tax=Galdieria sulphuraria TaxID=130081 RepID=M2WXI3_GALSU|nr:CCR4-NOT transcription complex subunit 6 [Galdieria sulphuraria]EME28760.1 CCR4-NOT transcription complex subunit 6 [Galdieria sulphuraria]GJD07105.1 Carbon catabolite repressor protein 4 homolog 4 [Galdieria sulphuraria]|eukprot:XP_005705280.1 CCR4-NOT transcription complex subunit 6 [Galdieria sulphuraria]
MTERVAPLVTFWTPPVDEVVRSFSISSYNMLAQVYVNTSQFPYCPRRYLRRKHRLALTKSLLQSLQVDILCLQEVDCYKEIETYLQEKGYKGIFQLRGGMKKDGCAIFFQSDKFELLAEHSWDCDQVQFPTLKKYCHENWNPYVDERHRRNNIGQCVWLKWRTESEVSYHLCIANVHLFWDPLHEDVKLLQTLQAVHEMDEFIQRCKRDGMEDENVNVFLTGDFNSSPGTLIYKLLTDGQVEWYGQEMEQQFRLSKEPLERTDNNNEMVNTMTTSRSALWTPIFARHVMVNIPFQFKSAIWSVLGKEMDWSNRTEKFTDNIDYIFYTGTQLKPIQVIPCPELLQRYEHFLPNENFPSDHIPLGCRFELVENRWKNHHDQMDKQQ